MTWTRALHGALAAAVLLSLAVTSSWATQASAPITVQASAATLPRFETLELTFTLPTTYENPYDPAQIDVRAIITTPDNQTEQAVGFWWQKVNYSDGGTDDYKLANEPGRWKVRYAPRQTGVYSYRIRATDKGGTTESAVGQFTATPAVGHGFVRVDPTRPTRFMFEDGTAFLARGSNLGWDNKLTYEQMFRDYRAAKLNFARVWLLIPDQGHFTLEWKNGATRQLSTVDAVRWEGLGRYNQENAHKLDRLMEQAKANDIALMLTLFTHHAFVNWNAENPYAAFGDGRAFWTNTEARRHFRNYVRYVGARYGAYTSLGIVEFWNELDDAATTPTITNMRAWHQEMVDTLHATSPRRPLTSTSFKAEGKSWNDPNGTDSFVSLPMLDVAQGHHYDSGPGATNMIWGWAHEARWANGIFGRPYFFGEYGHHGESCGSEPCHPNLAILNHHSTWSPIMHGGAASGNLHWRVGWSFFMPTEYRANARRFGDWIEGELPYLRQMDHFWGGENLGGFWIGGYRKANRAALYVVNKPARWDVADGQIADLSGASHTLTGLANGTYQVVYTNPLTGAVVRSESKAVTNGSLTLSMPTFKRDLAIKVHDPAETPGPAAPPAPTATSTPSPSATATATNTPPAGPTSTPPATSTPRATNTPAATSTPAPPTSTPPATATAAPAATIPTLNACAPDTRLTVASTAQEPATGTSANNLIDGKTFTRWETAWTRPAAASFTLVLPEATEVSCLRWRLGSVQYARAFRVEVSETGADGSWTDLSGPLTSGAVSNAWQAIRPAVPVTTRYIRWSFTNPTGEGKLGSFSEAEVHGR
jgi:hypothetical protein